MAATFNSGQLGTYNQTVGVRVDMDDAIDILPIDDVPLQKSLRKGPQAVSVKIEWLNEGLTPQKVTVNSTSAAASTSIALASGDGAKVRVNDILAKQDGTVQALVTAISTDTLTVTRPFAGSTDEGLAANDVLLIIGQYTPEGQDPADGRSVDRTSDYNYTQIDQEKVEVTRTDRKRAQRGGMFGLSDPYDHEVQKKFRELALRLERRSILGLRKASSDVKQRAMGGLFYYISTNTVSNTKANIETAVNDLMDKAIAQGGHPKTLWVSNSISRVLNALNASRVKFDPQQKVKGEGVVTEYASDYGPLRVVRVFQMPKTKFVVTQDEFINYRDFDDYFHEYLGKTGDAEKGQIVSEKSMEVRNENAHGIGTITDA